MSRASRFRRFITRAAALAVAFVSLQAAAQPSLQPPRLTNAVPNLFPQGEAPTSEVAVELEMIVAADGTVSDLKVVVPAGPAFDQAALDAARAFTFEPARRDGKAVPSKVRYRSVFTPPLPPPEPPPEPQPESTPPLDLRAVMPPAAAAAAPLEFGATARIEAPPREVTKRTMEAADLVRVAGTRGDALRAVELMPGIARPPAGAGVLIVRGSSPADTEVQMDGVPVSRLYHFGGLTSFVQGRLLDRINLYPGNFSARYGRKMGGIIEVAVRDPDTKAFHAMADINLIDTSVLAEGPVTNRLSLAFAAKRSYIDAFLGAVADQGDMDIVAAPVYYDYQILASWRPTDRDRVRTTIYGSADNFKLVLSKAQDSDPSVRGKLNQKTGFHRIQTAWQHRFDAVEQEVSFTVGPFGFTQQVGDEVALDGHGYEVFGRAEWRIRLGERLRLLTGVDTSSVAADIVYRGPAIEQMEGSPDLYRPLAGRENLSLDRNLTFVRPAGYAELAFEPIDRLLLVGGLRADWYGELDTGSIDPRLVGRYELETGTTFKGGVGLFSQPPDYGESLPVLGNPELDPSRAEHYSLGVEQKLGDLSLSVEGFHKRLHNLVVNSDVPGENLMNGGEGLIWGAEIAARTKLGRRGFGLLSYTLSRSRRNDRGDDWRTFDWDQPHILTLAGSLPLGRGWELGSTFRYVSGNPFTPVSASVYDANNDQYRARYGAINSARNEAFHQLDVRLEKVWRPDWGTLAAYADVQNAYNRRNHEGRVHKYDFSENRSIPGLPIIPSIGVRGEM